MARSAPRLTHSASRLISCHFGIWRITFKRDGQENELYDVDYEETH